MSEISFNPNVEGNEHRIGGGEIIKPPVLIVPDTFGKRNMDYAGFIRAGQGTERQQKRYVKETMKKIEWEAEILDYAVSKGIILEPRPIDADTMVPVLENNEYTVRTYTDDYIDEQEVLEKYAPEVKSPETFSIEEFEQNPFYPVVVTFQHPIDSFGGAGVYLLEVPAQFEKVKKFLENEGSVYKNFVEFKQYIETPSDRFTSFRVLVTASGRILASGVVYSEENKQFPSFIRRNETMDFARMRSEVIASNGLPSPRDQLAFLEIYESPYYLKSKRITSNLSRGGSVIPLDATESSRPITNDERKILAAHGLEDGKAPAILLEQARKIGTSLGRMYGLYSGIDFLMDKNGNFYYLETNSPAGLKTYEAVNNHGRKDKSAYLDIQKGVIDDIVSGKTE